MPNVIVSECGKYIGMESKVVTKLGVTLKKVVKGIPLGQVYLILCLHLPLKEKWVAI